jgi:stearoyl-CoA desaturase (delta-9 desaturase)
MPLTDVYEQRSAVETMSPTSQHREEPAAPSSLLHHKQAKQASGTNWLTAGFMLLFHVGALASVFFFSWTNLAVAVVLYFVTLNMGVCIAYHRLLTHRGFKTPKWIEYGLTACGAMALQGGPIFWVATHRAHHQFSDRDGDPHSPQDGTWWAHVGWILTGESLHADTGLLNRYVPDLMKDRFHVWISKYHWVPLVVLGAVLVTAGMLLSGWHGAVGLLLWGVFLRTCLGLHATWLVNSATHLWGKRRFDTKDDSHNNWWVALLTGGEGWHNNHHAHPVSARHGLAWYEFDPNYYFIWLLERVGLASKIQIAKFDWNEPKAAGVR